MDSQNKDVPYQITVNNIIPIGNHFMADYYIVFQNRQQSTIYSSPIVHGTVNRQNTRYPWTFIANTHKLQVHFHSVHQKSREDNKLGSTPLLLLKKDGQQQFLIFGCNQNNKGRKVAQIQFTYSQISLIQPISTSNMRMSLNYTNQQQQNHNSSIRFNIDNNIDNHIDNHIEPQNMKTLIEQEQFQQSSQQSRNDINLLRSIEDTTDRWYRKKFGKEKPINIQQYDFSINQNNKPGIINYQKEYEYLNDITFKDPHMQLRNIMINSDKQVNKIEIYDIEIDEKKINPIKIVDISINNGYKKEWNRAIRLPNDSKAFGVEIYTVYKQKLQGLIIKDPNYNKNCIELYNSQGKKVGNMTYSLKQLKQIQIQTLELMALYQEPIIQKFNQSPKNQTNKDITQSKNSTNKDFIKEQNKKKQQNMNKASQQHSLDSNKVQNEIKPRHTLINQIYLNRQKQTQRLTSRRNQQNSHHIIQNQQSSQDINKNRAQQSDIKNIIQLQANHKKIKRQISNQAYINRDNYNQKTSLKKNIRKNQYQLLQQHKNVPQNYQLITTKEQEKHLALQNQIYLNKPQQKFISQPPIIPQHHSIQRSPIPPKMPPKPNSSMRSSSKQQPKSNTSVKSKHISKFTFQDNPIQSLNMGNQQNQFLSKFQHQILENHHKSQQLPQIDVSHIQKKPSSSHIRSQGQHNQMNIKIDQIKRLSNELGKSIKETYDKTFNKQLKYKNIISNQRYQDNKMEQNKNINMNQSIIDKSIDNHQNSQNIYLQYANHKKTHRQPINATPRLQIINQSHHSLHQQKPILTLHKQQPIWAGNKQQPILTNSLQQVREKGNSRGSNKVQSNQSYKINKLQSSLINSKNPDQDLPIRRYKHTTTSRERPNINVVTFKQEKISPSVDHSTNKANFNEGSQKQYQDIDNETTQKQKSYKKVGQIGINTQRIGLIKNVMQSGYMPMDKIERKASTIKHQSRQIQHQQSHRQEVGSLLDLINHDNQRKTQQSSHDIKPSTQFHHKQFKPSKSILINTISVHYYQNLFGNKLVRIYNPRKEQYQTNLINNSNHLIWKCQGFVFKDILENQCLHVDFYNQKAKQKEKIGKSMITYDQIKVHKEVGFQIILRTYLTIADNIIGQIVIGYQTYYKQPSIPKNHQRWHTSHQYKTLSPRKSLEQNKKVTPRKKGKRRSKQDNLTEFLKYNRKQKINRYIVNEFSRANIESRINPIRQKKYTGGKNIIIGRDVRFLYSPQQQFHKNVPGPNSYKQQSVFQRYGKHIKQQQK